MPDLISSFKNLPAHFPYLDICHKKEAYVQGDQEGPQKLGTSALKSCRPLEFSIKIRFLYSIYTQFSYLLVLHSPCTQKSKSLTSRFIRAIKLYIISMAAHSEYTWIGMHSLTSLRDLRDICYFKSIRNIFAQKQYQTKTIHLPEQSSSIFSFGWRSHLGHLSATTNMQSLLQEQKIVAIKIKVSPSTSE